MTLPLRKKLPITVQNIRLRATALKRHARRGAFAAALVACSAAPLAAQSTGSQYPASSAAYGSQPHTSPNHASQATTWQPSRLPSAHSAQPLSQASRPASATQPANQSAGSDGSGVVLRWRESPRLSARAQQPTSHLNMAAAALDQPTAVHARAQVALSASAGRSTQNTNTAWVANPLRDSGAAQPATRQTHVAAASAPQSRSGRSERGAVRQAAYQAPGGTLDPFGDGAKLQQPPSLPPAQLQPMPSDPLSQPELAPLPPSSLPPSTSLPPGGFQLQQQLQQQPGVPQTGAPDPVTMPELNDSELMPRGSENSSQIGEADAAPQAEAPSPFDRAADRYNNDSAEQLDRDTASGLEQLERVRRADASVNCEYFRDRLRNATLDKINLKSGPRYGQGLGGDPQQAEKMRLDFASGAEEREWCDRQGNALVRGRMVDLYNELVVLDIDGVRREIPLRDLCDVDLAYIGKAWNLPISCGSGHDVYAARGFVPSAIQWKASGLCHKPLYFEEVQLERYGHEIGPVLQPLVSTAHFFGNIAVLPYKMGIHPPHECQYALGYYRPGDCAPYMLPPIPLSLRGAATQAGAVVGAAALVP